MPGAGEDGEDSDKENLYLCHLPTVQKEEKEGNDDMRL